MVLDDACRQFRFLESIRLDPEHLGELPESIGKLSRLCDLYIAAESFTLPSSFAQLTNLTCCWPSFRSERGSIEGLTPLLQLTNLKDLDLTMRRPLTKSDLILLEEFRRLTLLEGLGLDFPYLRKLPKFVVDLKSLRVLTLYNNNCLHRLPESLTRLSALQRLQLSSCRSLDVLPHNIGALKNLKELILISCKRLRGLPSSITELKDSLTLLNLNCLSWSSLPESIAALKSLKKLTICGFASIARVPTSLTQLTSLELLEFFYCEGYFFYEPHPLREMSVYKREEVWFPGLGE